jgi:hypothetical protein
LLKGPNPSPHILSLALLSLSITSSIPIKRALINNLSGNYPKTARARTCTQFPATTNSAQAALSKQNLVNVLESGIPHLSLSRFRDVSVTPANAIYNTSTSCFWIFISQARAGDQLKRKASALEYIARKVKPGSAMELMFIIRLVFLCVRKRGWMRDVSCVAKRRSIFIMPSRISGVMASYN